jgi:hypothetical protein
MIGPVGKAAANKAVREAGKLQAVWTVAKAEFEDPLWWYTLQHNLLPTMTKRVSEEDNFDLVEEAPPSEEDKKLNAFINERMRGPSGGNAEQLLCGEPAKQVAAIVGMGEPQRSSGPIRVLGSGGASDCIIVCSRKGGEGWITHADRTAPSPAQIAKEVGGGTEVYLASQRLDAPNPAASALLRGIITAIRQTAAPITAIYPCTNLAIDVKSGVLLTGMPKDELAKLSAGGGFEALSSALKEQKKEKPSEPGGDQSKH